MAPRDGFGPGHPDWPLATLNMVVGPNPPARLPELPRPGQLHSNDRGLADRILDRLAGVVGDRTLSWDGLQRQIEPADPTRFSDVMEILIGQGQVGTDPNRLSVWPRR